MLLRRMLPALASTDSPSWLARRECRAAPWLLYPCRSNGRSLELFAHAPLPDALGMRWAGSATLPFGPSLWHSGVFQGLQMHHPKPQLGETASLCPDWGGPRLPDHSSGPASPLGLPGAPCPCCSVFSGPPAAPLPGWTQGLFCAPSKWQGHPQMPRSAESSPGGATLKVCTALWTERPGVWPNRACMTSSPLKED